LGYNYSVASFRQHITFGALIGVIGTTLLYFYAFVTDPLLLGLLFIVTTIASFLPDLDSDSGFPFYLLFGTFTLLCTGISLLYVLQHYSSNLYYEIGVPLGVGIVVWFGVGTILKKFTHHRGMMHSLPTMAIVGLAAYLVARYFNQGDTTASILALAVAAGFLSHLMLDEVHAELNMKGKPFIVRRSLGTAMKLFSPKKGITLFTYAVLALLIYKAFSI